MLGRRERRAFKKTISTLVLLILLINGTFSYRVFANQIILDNKTQTSLETVGNVTNITTETKAGINALNSFSRFDVSTGNIVNLHLPTGTSNLLNLVHEHTSYINGVLNSIYEGQIGGNVYFLNPHGVVVGEGGQVNVGSLTLATPTTTFMDNFFTEPGVANSGLLQLVLEGRVPVGQTGLLSVKGKVNSIGDVTLQAVEADFSGEILSGAVFSHAAPDFSDVVNIRDYASGSGAVAEDGTIRIVATQIDGSGTLKTGGDVSMEAVSTSGGQAAITLKDSHIQANNVNLHAYSGLEGTGPLLNDVTAAARIELDSAKISASGDFSLSARADVEMETTSPSLDWSLPVDAAAAISQIDSSAVITVKGESDLQVAGDLLMDAENRVDVTSRADASNAQGRTAVGGSVAVGKVTTTTKVAVEGNTRINTGTLQISVLSDNRLETEARAAAQGAQEQEGSEQGHTQDYLDEYGEHAQTSEGGVGVAAALAINDLRSDTGILLGSSGDLTASGQIHLLSQVRNQSGVRADASTVEAGSAGVGVAVGINLAEITSQVTVDQELQAEALYLKAGALQDGDGGSSFATDAISGAGSSNVGVAGSLGVNVIETATLARLSGRATLAGDLDIQADNVLGSHLKALPAGDASGDALGVGASVAVNVVTNDVLAEMADGAGATGVQNLNVLARGEHTIQTEAKAGSAGGISLTPVAAVSAVNNTVRARLGRSEHVLVISGDLLVAAHNTGSVTTKAEGGSKGETAAIGASVAINLVEDSASALTLRSIQAGGDVGFRAMNASTSQAEAIASAKGGKEEDESTPDDGVDQDIAGKVGFARDKQGSAAGDTEVQSASTDEGAVSVAAAVSVNLAESASEAGVPDGVNIAAGGALSIETENTTDTKASADGSAVDGTAKVGIGAAVAINQADSMNRAYLGQGTHEAASLEVTATTPGENKSTVEATAGAGSSKVGIAGAVGINLVENRTEARLSGNIALSGDLEIRASGNSNSQVKVLPAGDASGDSLGVGASVAVNVVTNDVLAEMADGAGATGVQNLNVLARGEHTIQTEAKAGSAGGISLTPVAAVSAVNNTVRARLGRSEHVLVISGDLLVAAHNTGSVTTKAEGGSKGETAAIGASVAINLVEDSASALTLRSIQAGGDVGFRAMNASTSQAEAIASAKGGKEEDESTPDDGVDQDIAGKVGFARDKQGSAAGDTEVQSASTDEGAVSVAAAVSVNLAESASEAGVPDGVNIAAGGALSIETENTTDTKASADGSAVDGTAKVGIGAAVAINQTDSMNRAYLGQGTHEATSLEVTATTPGENKSAVEATAGAGSSKVGIAGAVGINIVDNTVDARINPSAAITVAGGDVTVQAQNDATHMAKAAPSEGGVSGDSLGVGASVALNIITEQVTAEISRGANLSGAGGITVDASSDSDTETEAKAGAEGGIAIDAAVAVTTLNQSTRAIIAEGGTLTTLGNVAVSSSSTGSHQATASGETKSGNVGIGAAVAVIVSNSSVSDQGDRVDVDNPVALSLVDRDLTTGGDLTVTALADRRYRAIGTASAKGAKADADQKGKSRSTSTLSENQGSQKGTQGGGTVTVAAAVGVTYINDDVLATIPGGESSTPRSLNVGGDLEVSALNASNFTSQGSGAAVDEQSKVGIGVGVGLSIQRNDTLASLGDYTTLRAKDLKVLAESKQNRDPAFVNHLAAEAVAGASAENVGVAGALAVVDSASSTKASLGRNLIVTEAEDISVVADNTSKLAAKAWAASKGGKVGVGASVATIVSKNQYAATIGSGSQILQSKNLDVIAMNRKVEGSVPFEFKDFESLDLQALIGENNYYTEVIAGAGGDNVAVAGAFAVNVFEDETVAVIGADSNVQSDGEITVQAENDTTAKALSGGVALKGQVGVGLASSDIVNKSTTQSLIERNVTLVSDDLSVTATAQQELAVFGVSAAGADKFGVAGVANVVHSENTVEAAISDSAELTNSGDLTLFAQNGFKVINIAGGAAGGGTGGIGASVATTIMKNKTLAYLGRGSLATVLGTARIEALARENLLTISAGGAYGGTAGVAGSSVVNVLNTTTHAFVGAGSRMNLTLTDSAGQNVYVRAEDQTDLTSVAGAASYGGTAGIGAAADVGVINKDTQAYIDSSSGAQTTVNAGNTVGVSAHAEENLISVAAGFAGGGTVGVAGTAGVYTIDNITRSFIGEYAQVHTGGNVLVSALNKNKLLMVSGSAAGSGTASVGGSGAVVTSNRLTEAYIGSFADVSALGKHEAINAYTGEFDEEYRDFSGGDGKVDRPGYAASDLTGDGTNDPIDNESLTKERSSVAATDQVRGVAVTAVTQDHLEEAAVGGAASGTVAVTGAGAVGVIESQTSAEIRSNAKINQTGENAGVDQKVLVAAGTDYYSLGIGGALSGSGGVAVGPGAHVSVVELGTTASIGNDSEVRSRGDITVSATTSENILSIAAAGSASAYAAISGAVTVSSLTNRTHAFIGDRAQVTADRSLSLSALDSTKYTTIAGGVALAVTGGGVGGSVAVNVINKDTQAFIGRDADVNAKGGALAIHAISEEDLLDVVASGGIGLFAGAAGAVAVNSVNSNTYAFIKDGARINQDTAGTTASQHVDLLAKNDLKLLSIAGTLAGGAVGVSGGVDVVTIKNNTAAYVEDGVNIKARGAFGIEAQSGQDIESYAVSAGAGAVGVAGAVSVVSVGSDLELDSKSVDGTSATSALETSDGSENVMDYAHGQITGNVGDQLLAGYEDTHIQGARDSLNAKTSTITQDSGGSVSVSGTQAFIGEGAQVEVGSLDMKATTDLEVSQSTGGVAGGVVGAGGAVSIATLNANTNASVGRNSNVQSTGAVKVTSELDQSYEGYSIAGAVGYTGSLAGSLVYLDDRSSTFARLDDDTSVQAGSLLLQSKAERDTDFVGVGASAGLAGPALSGTVIIGDLHGTTQAQVGPRAKLSITGALTVGALSDSQLTGTGAAPAGGLLAGLGAAVTILEDRTEVVASIEDDVEITKAGAVQLEAAYTPRVSGHTTGVGVGGLAVGASITDVRVSGQVRAFIGDRVEIGQQAGSSVGALSVRARFGSGADTAQATTLGGAAGGVAGAGSDATAVVNPTVSALVGHNARVNVAGNLQVRALSNSGAKAQSIGLVGAALGVGLSFAEAELKPVITAAIGDSGNIVAGGSVHLGALHNYDEAGSKLSGSAEAKAVSATGALVGGNGSDADAEASAQVASSIGSTFMQVGSNLEIVARSSNKSDAQADGVAAGGLVAAGAVTADSKTQGETTARLNGLVTAGNLSILAESTDYVTALTRSGAGGIAAGSGSIANARANSSTMASTGESLNLSVVGGAVSIRGEARSQAEAKARGVNAGGLAVGVSKAVADNRPTVMAYLGNKNAVFSDKLTIQARSLAPANGGGTLAESEASGGGLVGVNATISEAKNVTNVTSFVGDDSILRITGDLKVLAEGNSTQKADSTAITAGVVAVGSNSSLASSNSTISAHLGQGVAIEGGTVSISAQGRDDNYAESTAGSGGVVAGTAANAATSSRGGARAWIGQDVEADASSLELKAEHTVDFNAKTDSTSASLLGASGASTDNTVNYTVEASIDDDSKIEGENLGILAINRVIKDWVQGHNVQSGSGGVVDAAAVQSKTMINADTKVTLGENVLLAVVGDRKNPGALVIEGFSDLRARDRVKLDAGGAISVALAESKIQSARNTILQIGKNSTLTSVGDLDLSVWNRTDTQTAANVKTYGGAGAAQGKTLSQASINSSINIGQDVHLLAFKDTNLRIGSNRTGQKATQTVLANTDLWNKTVLPIETKPDADAYLTEKSDVVINTGSHLESVGHLRLLTDGGSRNVRGYGVGKDLYREALQAIGQFFSDLVGGGDVSLEIKAGRSSDSLTTGVRVDGIAEVGIENKRFLTIGPDGQVDASRSSEGYTISANAEDLSNEIQERIDELTALIQALDQRTGQSPSTTTDPAVAREIEELNQEKTSTNSLISGLTADINSYIASNNQKANEISANNQNIATWNAEIAALSEDEEKNAEAISLRRGWISAAQNANTVLQNQINQNNQSKAEYEQTKTQLQNRIGQINARLNELAALNIPDGGPGIQALAERYRAEKAMLEAQLGGLGNTSNVQVLTVDQEIEARSSNIYITADNLVGSGKLLAPGDTLIEVRNESPHFLRTNKMTIPDEAGGRIVFNQVSVSSLADINKRNRNQTAQFTNILTADNTESRISVINAYVPYGGTRAPDLFVDGDVRNLTGAVSLTSTYGSVQIKDGVDIVADSIRITAGRDITIGYKDGFRNIAHDIQGYWDSVIKAAEAGKTDKNITQTFEQIFGLSGPYEPSLLAGNNIFVSGQYLNINGVIQSGLPQRTLVIPPSLAAEIAEYKAKFDRGEVTDRIYRGLSINTDVESDISKVAVFYDAVDNTLELAPIFTMGGYMELYGHIMNTGVGELRVMDGYSQIQVDNQTNYDLRLKDINTGNGIEGTIKITDTGQQAYGGGPLQTVIKRQGNTVYTYNNQATGELNLVTAVAQASGRRTQYTPRANQYYSWTVKDERTWTEKRIEYFEKWFGFDTRTKTSYSGIESYNEVLQTPVGAAVLRVVDGKTDTYWYDRTVYPIVGSWSYGSWERVTNYLVYMKEERTNTRNMGEVIFHSHNIAAFHPIKIEFLGYDQGLLSVTSKGGIIIDGSLRNSLGETNIQSTQGAITQTGNELAGIIGQTVDLKGAAGMGSPSQAVGLQLVNNGVVNADTTSGDLYLEATRGDLVLGSIRAQDGDVYLGADTGIYGQTDSSLVTGTAVNLNVAHGNVASADRALRVNTEASSSGGLGVLAAGDIHITEVSGDLYLNQVESLGGDVILHTPDGSILDNNTDEIIDTRVEAELLGLWSEMGLTGEEAKESALHTVSAYERMKARQYADYWQLRERQVGADGSALGGEIYYPDSLIKLTDDEIRYYRESLGWDSDTIRALEAKMTRELHDLHQIYGSVSDTYIPDWTYTVLRPTDGSGSLLFDQYDEAVYDEWHSLVAGFVWTEDQLRNSIGVGVLKETSDTRVRIEEPNVIGRNVDLIASGNIGQDIANENIKLNGRTWTELEDWERLLILTAESKDVTILSDDEIQIVPKEDLDLRASGLIQARAAGSIFLGSEADLALARIEAGGDIRIKSRQNISHAAAAGEAAIKGQDLVLEAARGSIGTDSQAMVMDIGRFNLTARAGENIYISSPAHDLNIDTIYAVGHVDLHTEHAILNGTDPNQNIRAESLNLVAANGGIGTEGRFLMIGLDPTGQLTAQAKGDIFINSPVRRLNTGGITSEGDITIYGGDSVHVGSAGGGIYTLLGKVTIDARNSILSLHEDAEAAIRAQRIYLETQNGSVGSDQDDLRIDILGQGAFAADAPGGIYITETRGDLNVDSATSSAGNISLTAVEGDVNLETAAAHGGVTVDSKTGDTNLKTITAQTGDIVITAHGEANLGTLDAAGGSIRILADLGSVQLATATAYGELALTADQNAVVNTARTELGDLNLRAVRGDVTLGTAAAQGGNIGIMAEGDVEAATITAYGNVDVQARTGDAKLDTVLAQAGSVAVTAQNDVLVGSVTSEEGDVNLTAVTGDVPLGFVSAQEGTARILAGGSISGRSDETSIVATSLDLQAVTGAIGHADSPLNIDSSNKNTGTVRAQGYLGVYLHEVDGALHILAVESETEDVEIAADGSITGGQIKGEDITLSSIHGSIGEDDAYIQTEAGGRLNASAQGNIYLEQSGGDLISDQMLAAEGSIGLRVPDGQTQITQLSAGDGVTVRGLEDLWVGQAFAGTDLDLAVAGEGQYLEVDRADVGRSLSAHADHIRLPAVQHIGAEALLVAIGGGSKRMADSVVLNIDSPIGVIFTKLYAADMTIHADTDELMFLDVLVGNKATFSNRYHTVVADNVEKRLYENVALQLLPEDRPFSLRLGTDREIWTTAYAVNYNDYYIITNFDTINSFIRITTKLADIMGDIPSSILSGHSFSRFSNSEGLVGANEEEDEDEENQENLWDVIQIGSAI